MIVLTKKIKIGKKIDFRTRQVIADTVYDVLSDPDFGLEVRDDIKTELLKRSSHHGKTVSLATIRKRYL